MPARSAEPAEVVDILGEEIALAFVHAVVRQDALNVLDSLAELAFVEAALMPTLIEAGEMVERFVGAVALAARPRSVALDALQVAFDGFNQGRGGLAAAVVKLLGGHKNGKRGQQAESEIGSEKSFHGFLQTGNRDG